MIGNALLVALLTLGILAPPLQTLPWPEGVPYRPARPEAAASGPTAAAVDDAGALWLFDPQGRAFVRVGAEGRAVLRVPAPGLAQAFGVDARGFDVLDLSRREVLRLSTEGQVLERASLPAGLRQVRRLVREGDDLYLHSAWQESFRVPFDLSPASRDLRAWFTTRQEGLRFPGTGGRTVALRVHEGRALIDVREPARGPTRGRVAPRTFPLAWEGPVLAAEVVGPCGPGWWLRVTTGAPGAAQDFLAQVDDAGRVLQRHALEGARTLSWAERLRVSAGGDLVYALRPTDQGIVVDAWRLR